MRVKNLRMVGHIAKRYGQGRTKAWLTMLSLLCFALPASATALTPISQGYVTKDTLALGSLVGLQKDSADHVEAASVSNVNNLLGIVIDAGNSLLSLSNGQTNQIQVATS